MTAVDGGLPPSLPSDSEVTTASKRKHDDISNDGIVNGEHTANDRQDPIHLQSAIQSVWQVLNTRGYPSSILSHVSSYQPSLRDQSDGEHVGKKQKLFPAPKSATIASLLENGGYDSFDAFASDVDTACSDLSKQIQSKDPPVNGYHYWPLPPENLEQQHLLASIASFTKLLASLVHRQQQPLRERSSSHLNSPKQIHSTDIKVNGIPDDKSHLNTPPVPQEPGRTVLTLFGNAQGQKQLFSSLQRPFSKSRASDSFFATTDASAVPLREHGLPPGIASTKIVPTPTDDSATLMQHKRLALGDVFATPSTVPALPPPKTPKLPSTHDSTVTWSQDNAYLPARLFGYTGEKLATGAWLGYNGISPAEEPATPQAKRKQRDRALSIGESTLISSQVTKAAQVQAEEEALFRSAYSSFAPSIDNSIALISEDTRNTLWWYKYGGRSLELASDDGPDLDSNDDDDDDDSGGDEQVDEDQLFKDAVEDFTPPTPPEASDEPAVGDADAMLEEVWRMLEILNSYQRIRMSSLSSGNRSSLVQNSQLQHLTSDPTTPSAAELDAYTKLKARLASIISELPPYAVAKLNGDQLNELNVSRDIPIGVGDYRGVMEEDKASRDAKQAAYQAAVGVASVNSRHAPIQPASHSRSQQMSQSGRPPPHQHYSQNTPQAMQRGQPQFARQPLSSWQKPNGTYQMSTQRPSYANPQHFNQQTPRNVPAPIRPSYSQMTPGRPAPTPQLPNGGYQASGGQINYQQPHRPQSFGSPNLNIPNSNYVPQAASPSKMMQQQQPPPRNYSPHSQYPSQNQQMPMQQPLAQGSPTQYSQSQPAQQLQRQQPQQMQPRPPQTPQTGPQQPQQNKALSTSPMPRPSSSGGTGTLGTTNANTETAVESRSGTPATTVTASTPVPPQAAIQPPPQAPIETVAASVQVQEDSTQPSPANQPSETKAEVEPEDSKLLVQDAEMTEA